MARSSADDLDLRNQCQAALESGSKVVLSIRVVETRGAAWAKGGRLGRQMAKPRVLAISTKIASPGEKAKAFLHVLKYSSGGVLELAKDYKLKHLSKMELNANDPSGCTFILGFDNLRSQSVAPSLWTMRNKDDRNRLLVSLLNMCRDLQDRLPKVVGIDIVEMALWAKENTPAVSSKTSTAATATEAAEAATSTIEDGPTIAAEDYSNVAVTRDLVSHAEEEDMEALLDAYVMGIGEAEQFSERLRRELLALEAANVHALLENEPLVEEVLKGLEAASLFVEDMDEWLRIFNVKLRHMREDIESIESRNNKLELQSVNNMALLKELEKLLVHLRIPTEVEECLIGDSFDDAQMSKILECCEWLSGALHGLVQNIDPCYVNMRAVKEKRGELEILKSSFVTLSSEFLRCFFSKLVDFMISDLSHFSQKGQLKVPGHDELKRKCMTHARLLQILKVLDKRCLVPLRKVYCHSLNLLLRREAREFANELRASIKTPKNPQGWLEIISTSSQAANTVDTVTNAYFKMLSIFVPLLVDESSFFAYFMGFGVTTHAFPNASNDMNEDFGTMDNDEWECVQISPDDMDSLNASLRDLLDGIQEDFYAVLDWACKIDPLRCISMHGITENYLSEQKSDTSGFVRMLLSELLTRISAQFGKFIDETCHQIERNERNVKQTGVLSYITKFAILATRMEQYIQGQSRELVDLAYTKIVNVMFVTLERISQADPKYPDIVLIENYAAFQNSLYDLANVVPTLAKFYHQASESYEKACTNHINMIIYIQFEKLFTFAQKIEDSMYTLSPEEIPFQIGLSKADLRKILKSSLSSVDKAIVGMSKRLQKNFTSEELLPSLWDKCKKQFADKYESFTRLVAKVYPTENIPSATEMRDLLASM